MLCHQHEIHEELLTLLLTWRQHTFAAPSGPSALKVPGIWLSSKDRGNSVNPGVADLFLHHRQKPLFFSHRLSAYASGWRPPPGHWDKARGSVELLLDSLCRLRPRLSPVWANSRTLIHAFHISRSAVCAGILYNDLPVSLLPQKCIGNLRHHA